MLEHCLSKSIPIFLVSCLVRAVQTFLGAAHLFCSGGVDVDTEGLGEPAYARPVSPVHPHRPIAGRYLDLE